MRTTIRWSTIPLLLALLVVMAREGLSGAAAPPSTSKPSGKRSYHPETKFVITLDLAAAPPPSNPANYRCVFTYETADGGSQPDRWDFISAHRHGMTNTVTLKFTAHRTKTPKTILSPPGPGSLGTGTIVISFPTAPTIPPTDNLPVEDPGVDPCS